jgi:hypothetical protein
MAIRTISTEIIEHDVGHQPSQSGGDNKQSGGRDNNRGRSGLNSGTDPDKGTR